METHVLSPYLKELKRACALTTTLPLVRPTPRPASLRQGPPPCLVPYAGLATIHAAGPRAILGHVQWAAVDASAAPAVCSYARDIRGRSHNDMRAPVPAQKVLSAKSKFWQGLRQEDEPFRIKPALISAPGIG